MISIAQGGERGRGMVIDSLLHRLFSREAGSFIYDINPAKALAIRIWGFVRKVESRFWLSRFWGGGGMP